MAQDGYLPAYVALRVFSFREGTRFADKAALQLLRDAAEKGDVSAMCAMMLPITLDVVDQTPGFREARERLLQLGAEKGHGACLAVRGSRQRALPDLLEAARQGYFGAHRSLFYIRKTELQDKDFKFSDPLELRRTLCWGRLAQQHTNWVGFDIFLSTLKGILPRNLAPEDVERLDPQRRYRAKVAPEYLPLLDAYDPGKVPIARKVVTPETCIALEQQILSK